MLANLGVCFWMFIVYLVIRCLLCLVVYLYLSCVVLLWVKMVI